VLEREGNLDSLTVLVERREGVGVDAGRQAGAELRHLVKSSIGVSVGVDVVEPESVERSVGKMRRIVDRRPPR
jgi:phenylacetate-CoA ligase